MTAWQTCRRWHTAPWEAHTDCCDAPRSDRPQVDRDASADPYDQADRALRRSWPAGSWELASTPWGPQLTCARCGHTVPGHHAGHVAFGDHLAQHVTGAAA